MRWVTNAMKAHADRHLAPDRSGRRRVVGRPRSFGPATVEQQEARGLVGIYEVEGDTTA